MHATQSNVSSNNHKEDSVIVILTQKISNTKYRFEPMVPLLCYGSLYLLKLNIKISGGFLNCYKMKKKIATIKSAFIEVVMFLSSPILFPQPNSLVHGLLNRRG